MRREKCFSNFFPISIDALLKFSEVVLFLSIVPNIESSFMSCCFMYTAVLSLNTRGP